MSACMSNISTWLSLADEFSAILSKFQSGNGVLSVRRAKRTVPHLQAAWTLHIVCKANPHHPRCSQHVAHDNDQDFDIIARYNRRKYRHRRRHSHRHWTVTSSDHVYVCTENITDSSYWFSRWQDCKHSQKRQSLDCSIHYAFHAKTIYIIHSVVRVLKTLQQPEKHKRNANMSFISSSSFRH